MDKLLFAITILATSSLLVLALISLWREEIRFWPPPDSKSWQYYTFWTLFRIMFGGVIILSILDFNPVQLADLWWRYYLGMPFTVIGFGLAFYITFSLGWQNAHGQNAGLKTDGWFRWSRNFVGFAKK